MHAKLATLQQGYVNTQPPVTYKKDSFLITTYHDHPFSFLAIWKLKTDVGTVILIYNPCCELLVNWILFFHLVVSLFTFYFLVLNDWLAGFCYVLNELNRNNSILRTFNTLYVIYAANILWICHLLFNCLLSFRPYKSIKFACSLRSHFFHYFLIH